MSDNDVKSVFTAVSLPIMSLVALYVSYSYSIPQNLIETSISSLTASNISLAHVMLSLSTGVGLIILLVVVLWPLHLLFEWYKHRMELSKPLIYYFMTVLAITVPWALLFELENQLLNSYSSVGLAGIMILGGLIAFLTSVSVSISSVLRYREYLNKQGLK